MVVTRHISHDGLLIWPQGANDVCPGNRGKERGQRGEKMESKSVQRQKGQQRATSRDTRFLQSTSALLGFSDFKGRVSFIVYEVGGKMMKTNIDS